MTALTSDQMLAMIQQLKNDNAKLLAAMQAAPARRLTYKVTAKKPDGKGTDGALSIYGLGQFPTTLYASQWERILDAADELRLFIKANDALLVRKG